MSVLGGSEVLWIGLALIILFGGASQIPKLARSIGRSKGEFEKGRIDAEREVELEPKMDTDEKMGTNDSKETGG